MVDILKAIPGTASSQLLTSWISDIMLPFILQQLPLMLVSTVGLSYRETCCNYYNITVKPHLVATSVMRPPHYNGQVQQVQTYFPLYYIYVIFVNRATSLLSPVATRYRTKLVKLIQCSLSKEAS